MEALAEINGDIEELVAVKSRDLSSGYRFLEIATIYKNFNMSEKALEWSEKGIKAFPKNTSSDLRDFLAEEYHNLKRFDDEMKLIWANFSDLIT